MEENNKLTGLIEQAACSINMLNPSELSELDELLDILKQIDTCMAEITQAPAKLLALAKGTTSNASQLIQNIIKEQVDDANASVDMVSKAVSSLQQLVDQIQKTPDQLVVDTENTCTETIKAETVQENENRHQTISENDAPLVRDFIAESIEHIKTAEAGLLTLEKNPDDNKALNQTFRPFHTIEGMAGFLNLSEIGSLAHSTKNLLDDAKKGELVLSKNNIKVVFESVYILKNMISELNDTIKNGTPIKAQKDLPQLLKKLETTVQAPNTADETPAPKVQEKQPATNRTNTTARKVDEKIKVSTTRLDDLVNMTGELVIAQLMVSEKTHDKEISIHELNRRVAHQGKIIRELQELSMSMRMVPIAGVFQKMARLVRDLSQKSGKKISFIMSGEETELDRSIVDKIADPLVHMVRNSIDHGIEPPEERQKAGKDHTGQIELKAYHQAGSIVIEIKDNGRGLNKDMILKKAIDNGIVDQNQELTDDEIYKLIFHAGLSTAKKITSISGRGVGMDVVKKNLESLRGKIDISTKLGKGTTFIIKMPLTLAIIDGQIVNVGSNRYIVPINSIVKTHRPQKNELFSVQNNGEMVMVQGQLLPMIRLYDMFDIEPNTTDPTKSLLVVVEEDGKKCCLLVNELLGQQQVVIKNLGEGLGTVKGVSGGAIMGDGKVSLILDIPEIIKLAQN